MNDTPAPLSQPEVQGFAALAARLAENVNAVVLGKPEVVRLALTALFAQGHVLLEDVPGVGKTTLARAVAATVQGQWRRIQFTPDLLPSDVSGVTIFNQATRGFEFHPGPVFANIVIADEINRASPKTQSALLEVMEERQVSVEGARRPLPEPFIVAATQNPVEYEGTYPLPEAQLDRFLLKLTVPLPNRDEELGVLRAHHAGFDPRDLGAAGVRPVAGVADLAAAREAVGRVHVAEPVLGYIVDLCRATRTAPALELGASPRGATGLLSTAKAWAWLAGRDHVTPDDVKATARPTLRHRLRLRPEVELEGVGVDMVLDTVLATVPTPR
ncbi:AAA family ATPase [Streptomyces microflavus]|uniref:AAA family ATPase n=1 Tax=Streptomyces microflavus TaxID=1919 RepID=UPI003F4D061E